MLTRGRNLVLLATREIALEQQFDIPSYETTKGVDLNCINTDSLRAAIDLETSRKPIAHVSPTQREQQPVGRLVNTTQDLDYVETSVSVSPVNVDNPYSRITPDRVVTRTPLVPFGDSNINSNITTINGNITSQNSCQRDLRSRNKKDLGTKENYNFDSDSPQDPFADSGSAYSPSSVSVVSNSTDGAESNCLYKWDTSNTDADNHCSVPTEVNPLNQKSAADNESSQPQISVGIAAKVNGKRMRNKEHACYFCQTILCNNLARHMEMKHGSEIEIARILAMPKKSKERRDAFNNLIKYGDFYHNCDVLSIKRGELILTRRPNTLEQKMSTYSDYGPCPECLGFFLKRHIWHHLNYTCTSKSTKSDQLEKEHSGKGPVAESTALLNGILGSNLTPEFLEIVNKFRDDNISRRCKEDETIMRYGAFLFEKYSSTQSELIRQSMRQLARLTLQLKEQGEMFQNLNDVLVPEKFDSIVAATKALCKTQREDPTKRPEFGIPSLALKIGYGIKKCAAIERGQCLRRGDLKKNKKYLGFLHLLNLEWSVRISSNALSTMYARKKNAEDLLPITSDLLKLNRFLDLEIKNIKKKLCQQNYYKLASLTLARVIMFNKRRSGETAKMTLQQYWSKPNWDDTGTQEIKESLTPFENKLASSLTIVKIVGKRGRIVPIILTNDMKESVELLITKRVEYGILSENPYIFALANTEMSHLRGHDCLKKWCIEAEVQSPNLVTSTKLRKYVATVCQIFNLTDNEYDWLARHLGHDIRVHREFYRLQENAVELTKVSRLLLAVDQGEAHKFKDKQLKDINIQDLDGIDEEREQEEEDIDYNESQLIETSTITPTAAPVNNKNRRKCQKTPWTSEEKTAVLQFFKVNIKNSIVPKMEQCNQCINENQEALTRRSWKDVKNCVYNEIKSRKKKTKK